MRVIRPTMRVLAALTVALSALLAGCGGDDADTGAADGTETETQTATEAQTETEARTTSEEEAAAWADEELVPCRNEVDGYEIGYPESWETNSADVMAPCSLFDPQPIDIEPGTEIPREIAVVVRIEPVPYERIVEGSEGEEILSRDEPEVDDLTATRIESRATENTVLRPEGTLSTRWMVDLGGEETLVATATESPEGRYEQEREVLDRMMGTLTLLPGDGGAAAATTTTTAAG